VTHRGTIQGQPSRLRLRAGRAWSLAATVLVVATSLATATATAPSAQASGTPTTYQGHQYGAGGIIPTADKPQSKLWWNDGSWWALMLGSSTVNIYRLDSDHRWTNTGTVVDTRAASTGDALWTNGKLYVASRATGSGGSIRISRFSYSPTTRTYSLDGGFPVSISGSGTESVTIDRDSTGKLWITFTRSSRVWVSHTTTGDNKWRKPFQIPGFVGDAISKDDISSLISMGDRIGVLWSDQESSRFNFAYHRDGDPDSVWSSEVPLSGSRVADDHMNLKTMLGDDQGRLYAAVKTSNDAGDSGTAPLIFLLVRDTDGTWTRHAVARVQDDLTRPQIVLDRTHRELTVLMSQGGGGSVYAKTASLDNLTFADGLGSRFITYPGAAIRDVTVAKEPVNATTGIVAAAVDTSSRRYYHAELDVDPGTDLQSPTVVSTTPVDGATSASASTQPSATFSEQLAPATVTSQTVTLQGPEGSVAGTAVYDTATASARFVPAAALQPGATYVARASTGITDLAGNALTQDVSWTFSVAVPPSNTQVPPSDDTYVTSDQPSASFGTSTTLLVMGNPRTISYFKYDLSEFAGRAVTAATLQVPVAGNSSTGTQYVRLTANDSWSESTLTYDRKPAVKEVLGSLSGTTPWTTVSVPLDTAVVTSKLGGTLSIGVATTSTDDLLIASKESGTPVILTLEF
jgi:hypothetical protein